MPSRLAADEASAQLASDLHQTTHHAFSCRRPILHHLNADSSWLLQIPQPEHIISQTGRTFFNILIDPWLSGGQSDVASWFSQQFHATESKVPTIAAVEQLCRASERIIAEHGTNSVSGLVDGDGGGSLISAVAISHEFTDHCHKDTLLEVDPSVPVFATDNAAKLIASWKHFTTVQTVPGFGGEQLDWRRTSTAPLPEWLSISRVVTAGDALYYHSAVLIAYNNSGTLESEAECVIYTPHGIHAPDLRCIASAEPRIRTLAFLHGLHDITLSRKQLNLGAHNGLKAQRLLRARYWIGTHDEVKTGKGLVSWWLYRKAWTLEDALREEREKGADAGEEVVEDANWLTLENGESRVLT